MTLTDKKILLIISGGIAAYKSLELIRLIKKSSGEVKCILTKGGEEFITPLSVSSLSGEKCYTDLFSLIDELEMGHIQLSRWADLIIVAPATADIMAKMAHGLCNDLATTALLATNIPVMIVPAMNPAMWEHQATKDNLQTLINRKIQIIEPEHGDMACGETGQGRMVEAQSILNHMVTFFSKGKPLLGKTAIVTSGPTFEPIDPVRFIGNRSSGKQGTAIACALRDLGADVTLITGPTAIPNPDNMNVINIETANEMMTAVEKHLPVDIAVCAAAVADYGVTASPQKHKKSDGDLKINLTENPDILKTISTHKNRPKMVIGFAAETENLIDNAYKKLASKQCDAIIANNVGDTNSPVFGNDMTSVHWITKLVNEAHENLSKTDVASMIANKIIDHFNKDRKEQAA